MPTCCAGIIYVTGPPAAVEPLLLKAALLQWKEISHGSLVRQALLYGSVRCCPACCPIPGLHFLYRTSALLPSGTAWERGLPEALGLPLGCPACHLRDRSSLRPPNAPVNAGMLSGPRGSLPCIGYGQSPPRQHMSHLRGQLSRRVATTCKPQREGGVQHRTRQCTVHLHSSTPHPPAGTLFRSPAQKPRHAQAALKPQSLRFRGLKLRYSGRQHQQHQSVTGQESRASLSLCVALRPANQTN